MSNNIVKTRDSARNAIKRYMTKSNGDEAVLMDYETITSYLQLLNEQWERFRQAQDAIEIACGAENLTMEEDEREQAEIWYSSALANLNRLKKSLVQPADTGRTTSQVSTVIQLPKMELPSFSGDTTEWISFHDAFQSLVDSNANLTPGQKLHYLRSCLKEEALHVISSFKICDANYDEAWDLLKSRYRVIRVIVEGHFRAISDVGKSNNDSAASIKHVLDTILQHTRALKALGRPVEFWDDWLVHLVVDKLAFETRKQWELSLETDEPPTFDHLQMFLETRCRSLAILAAATTADTPNKYSARYVPKKSTNVLHAVEDRYTSTLLCSYCNGDHKIYDCEKFGNLNDNAKTLFIKESGACWNCLSRGHYKSRCRSNSTCRICRQHHHTLLHSTASNAAKTFRETSEDANFSSNSANAELKSNSNSANAHIRSFSAANRSSAAPNNAVYQDNSAASFIASPDQSIAASTLYDTTAATANATGQFEIKKAVLLATALVNVQDCSGRWQTARVLFDTGSHASFITESCVQRLRLPRVSSSVFITGIGSANGGCAKGETSLILSSRLAPQLFKINALILSKITNELPSSLIPVTQWSHVQNLPLADPQFMKPAPIDVLIGMDEIDQFITPEIRKGATGTPMAQSTVFGWLLFGRIDDSRFSSMYTQTLHCDIQLVKALSKLWELEETTKLKHLTAEEKFCEDHFDFTHRRAFDGRFIVELPLKRNVTLGESRSCAVRSLLRMERRFATDESLRDRYKNFMQELIDLNHMEAIENMPNDVYYMPHHAVLKESSATTKLRVVFNASAKSSTGHSLNDALMVGPQLQQDLFSILMRFRTHRYALSADVAKMYRQVYVSTKHVDFQRIVWRPDPSLPIQDYRMLRVTYGVAAASHLAVKALQQAAKSSINEYKQAASVILRDFYMDDLLTGSSNKQDLQLLQRDISTVLSNAGFELRQWASNCPQMTASIPLASKEISHYLAEGKEVNALGLIWNTEDDFLTFAVTLREPPKFLSKRAFLSDASTLFDPLGLLAPCTIKSKIWFQDIWRSDADWDDAVPKEIAEGWLSHRKELNCLSSLKLDRWLGFHTNMPPELHIFADASERAFAAVIYARTIQPDGTITVKLVTSKTKVAPLKVTSLPRLELCAAHLAAKLTKAVISSWVNKDYTLYAWTDSTITIAWLQAHPGRWATFIANRVAETQETLPPECWNHVRSEHNPADCASRGVTPTELVQHQLWWSGPCFLRNTNEFWKYETPTQHTTELEIKSNKLRVHVVNSSAYWALLKRYSSYSKLKRVVAYVLRFLVNIRARTRRASVLQHGPLSCKELLNAELALIRYSQNYYFSNEISHCSAKKPLPLRSSLLRLQPFLDEMQILRVGGRLKNANVTVDVKHPIILSKNCPLAKLLIAEIHIYTLHAGPQIMQVVLQRRFWVISGRNLVRGVYRKCVKCTCLNRNLAMQSMAELPTNRATYARCFLCSAVDFAGPYAYKFTHGRGAKSTKGYICSFVCMGTGAMHLEFVGDLTTASFLNAFKRFINRRGYCKTMHSDNGTNFVGAEKELRCMFERCMADDKVRSFFVDSSITWKFNPPKAPHMGGYWEIGIKRIKYHIKRALGDNLLSYEEFSTLLTEIEACVNSRPLCTFAADASDLEILTPGHFIVGEPLKILPEPEAKEFTGNLHRRWHAISSMRQHFWQRWRDEYLVSLQRRTKWFRSSSNLKKDDVVAINECTPPTKWKLARVIKCHPGRDGRVRVVTLKAADGEFLRPVVKLCPLPTKCDIFCDDEPL